MRAILSIQSDVAYGHVGHAAAVLPLQRLGFEVWPVDTVQLGHHPGYGRFRGHLVEPERLEVIVDALLELAPLARCSGLLAGYLGAPDVAEVVLKALDAVQRVRPDLTFLLDPVIGDDGNGVFVRAGVPEAIRSRLLPRATIVTPNRFELGHLTGRRVESVEDACAAAESLLAEGPALVVATGLTSPERADELAMLALSARERLLVRTPKLGQAFSGSGDAFSALFLGHYLCASNLGTALERAASAIFSLVELTQRRGERELSLVAAQDLFAAAEPRFPAVAI